VLVTTTEYNTAGRAYKTTDPASKEQRTEFDDLGRATKTMQRYDHATVDSGNVVNEVAWK
jgi:uncharacterized protein RhaS with RHS repeats